MAEEALRLTDDYLRHLQRIRDNYKKFSSDPENAEPMFHISFPVNREYTIRETLYDPRKMLKNIFTNIRAHIEVMDDFLPAVRVEFGTGQTAHAFGCELFEPENSPPCAKTHVLNTIEEAADLPEPALDAGWFKRLYAFTEYFREHTPEEIPVQTPDLQGPFNNAHLIRGNDILVDFYDNPEAVKVLLQKITSCMSALQNNLRNVCNEAGGFFHDWGAAWKGGARISNCSLHMISTEFYREFIRDFDRQYLESAGGGRIHYCGTHDNRLFEEFFSIPGMSGVDYDGVYHNFWDLAGRTPPHIALLQYTTAEQVQRLLAGDWPAKRNIIIQTSAPSAEAAKELLARLRQSVPVK
jgi:hypothetical protein